MLWLGCFGLLASGDLDWLTIALLAFASTTTFILLIVYVLSQRRAVVGLRRFKPPEVAFKFSDDGFTTASSIAETAIRWNAIQKLWRFPEVWLLFVTPSQYVTLPVDQIPVDLQADILAKIRSVGATVK